MTTNSFGSFCFIIRQGVYDELRVHSNPADAAIIARGIRKVRQKLELPPGNNVVVKTEPALLTDAPGTRKRRRGT